ncbi:partial arthrofactin-type cyclic lipopeptide synthetase C, partial [Burkholderiaceae bacterium]
HGSPKRLLHVYGPTETTTFCAWFEVDAESLSRSATVPIGRGLAGSARHVLDAHGRLAGPGTLGELHVAGDGLARGYLNQPTLTAEKFIDAPAAELAGRRLYRTGDIVRWQADGHLEFIGRADGQVKIRGFRVELGEIQARLLEHDHVRQAVVLLREDEPGDKRLVAYCVTDEPGLPADGLRAHLAASLPEVMVPAAFVMLPALPLTPNGKLDRQALPVPADGCAAVTAYEPPQGETECALSRIWADVLKIERVGRHDNFFDLGGHSLVAVSLIVRLRQELEVELPLQQLFESPTLAALSERVVDAQLAQFAMEDIEALEARP